jgi:hypothetical protein
MWQEAEAPVVSTCLFYRIVFFYFFLTCNSNQGGFVCKLLLPMCVQDLQPGQADWGEDEIGWTKMHEELGRSEE